MKKETKKPINVHVVNKKTNSEGYRLPSSKPTPPDGHVLLTKGQIIKPRDIQLRDFSAQWENVKSGNYEKPYRPIWHRPMARFISIEKKGKGK